MTERTYRIYLDPTEARCTGRFCTESLKVTCARATAEIGGSPLSDFSLGAYQNQAPAMRTSCDARRVPQERPKATRPVHKPIGESA